MNDEVITRLEQIETRLGLPAQFYLSLNDGDDWSFAIKLSALFEASSTQLLTVRLGTPVLGDAFAHLDYGNQRFGKLALLKMQLIQLLCSCMPICHVLIIMRRISNQKNLVDISLGNQYTLSNNNKVARDGRLVQRCRPKCLRN